MHAGEYVSRDGSGRRLEGWAEQLSHYAKDPSKIYNRARSGANSNTYLLPDRDDESGFHDRYWSKTEELIVATEDNNGGFLLIQFGANDFINGVEVEDFKNALKAYISDAKRLELTPILISPPNARNHNNSRPYAEYVESTAKEQNVTFLDLYQKSKTEWATYDLDEDYDDDGSPDNSFLQTLPEADRIFAYLDYDGSGINNTHLAPRGARIIAGWVRELACTYEGDFPEGAEALCEQFKAINNAVTTREDAEDSSIDGWTRYASTEGSNIDNIFDGERGHRVIELSGNDGTDNAFRLDGANLWEDTESKAISWSMNYSDDFIFLVSVDTEDGYKIFEYRPNNNPAEIVGGRYRFGLGSTANDGTWHTFTRNLQADLKSLDPSKNIVKIHKIAIKGSGRVDDIKTMLSVNSLGNEVPPVITVTGNRTINVLKDSVYHDAGATASDDIDGDISASIVFSNNVDTSTCGSYTVVYKVKDSAGNENYNTRIINVVEADADEVTVHEDAEDGDITGWGKYGMKEGSIIDNIEDNGNRVIKLSGGNGIENGFNFPVFNVTSGFVASWRLKYAEDFRFFVQIRSVNSPDNNIYMEYTPTDIGTGLNGNFIVNGLGTSANDGTWHTFTRDIEADFNVVYPDDSITRIVGFSIRGSGLIDDISTSTRASVETFSYNGHHYKIVKNALSWQDASDAAHADGGYLANIGSIAENHEIYSRLNRFIVESEYANTVASNGGGASYVWIGGNDLDTEGTWKWENNAQEFWSGSVGGSSVGGLYSNWGRGTDEVQHEPDNASNQDATAIALTRWPIGSGSLGQASQWNDLIATDALYYIIEYDDQQEIVLNELKAFPTAEGAGAGASGGRGGDVVYVTNWNASGEGSLRWALTREFNRTIVFAIGGRFNINESIFLGQWKRNKYTNDSYNENFNKYNNFTLAGQTANDKGGVHLATSRTDGSERSFSVACQENMILRYFDSRYNWHFFYREENNQSHQPTLRFVDVNNLIIDHVTSGWSSYGFIITNYTLTPRKIVGNITVQRSLVHEGTMIPANIDAVQHNHNVGMLLGRAGNGGEYNEWNMMGKFSILKNAYIGVSHRFPNIAGSDNGKFQIVNNYTYGFLGDDNVRLARVAGNSENDFINNVFQRTPYSPEFTNTNLLAYDFGNFMPIVNNELLLNRPNYYISGNLFLNPFENVLNITNQIQNNPRLMLYRWKDTTGLNYPAGNLNEENHHLTLRNTPTESSYPISVLSADEVKSNILNNVGGNIRFRDDGTTYIDDPIDEKYINTWAKNNGGPTNIDEFKGTTALGNSVRFIYPDYNTDPAVDLNITDTDRDGMPNSWELANNLDPDVKNNNAIRADRNWNLSGYRVINNAGYTDLEMYLADIAGDFHMLAKEN